MPRLFTVTGRGDSWKRKDHAGHRGNLKSSHDRLCGRFYVFPVVGRGLSEHESEPVGQFFGMLGYEVQRFALRLRLSYASIGMFCVRSRLPYVSIVASYV